MKINGYHEIIMKTRTNKRGGGVGIYIKENYKFVVNETMNKLDLKKLK